MILSPSGSHHWIGGRPELQIMKIFRNKPRALLIRAAGTNCDIELAEAFRIAGADSLTIHVDLLIRQPDFINDFHIIAIPGGFSYGDDIAAGRILALKIRQHLAEHLQAAVSKGVPVLGICNGFQVLVQTGLLPGIPFNKKRTSNRTLSLAENTNGRFIDDWVPVSIESDSPCIWTKGITDTADMMILPVAHAEGRFLADPQALNYIEENNLAAIRYLHNPNGSIADIAGICDPSGLVFGLMPHPERYVRKSQHPSWTRIYSNNTDKFSASETIGLRMIRQAVIYVANK